MCLSVYVPQVAARPPASTDFDGLRSFRHQHRQCVFLRKGRKEEGQKEARERERRDLTGERGE